MVANQLPTGLPVGHGLQLLGIPSGLDWQLPLGCNQVQSGPVTGLFIGRATGL